MNQQQIQQQTDTHSSTQRNATQHAQLLRFRYCIVVSSSSFIDVVLQYLLVLYCFAQSVIGHDMHSLLSLFVVLFCLYRYLPFFALSLSLSLVSSSLVSSLFLIRSGVRIFIGYIGKGRNG